MSKKLVLLAFVFFISVIGPCLLAQSPYDLPNDNTGCPGSCRQIPWRAGSDQWNGGTLPNYTQDAACTGIVPNGVTDNTAAINACIAAAASGHAVYLPAGVYYVAGTINMKSNVALRGAKAGGPPWLPAADATATTLRLGTSGAIAFSKGNSSLRGSSNAIQSGYTKGSTRLVLTSAVAVGTWLFVSEDNDASVPVTAAGHYTCTWCGWDDSSTGHLLNQFVQVTAVNAGGCGATCVDISRPMYYTYKSTLNPVARSFSFAIIKAGLENLRLDGSPGEPSGARIHMYNSLFCWVKGVETYMGGANNGDGHLVVEWSHGAEFRDNYHHYGWGTFGSGSNYGLHFMKVNSDHKVENNIIRVTRHGFAFEGGGAGVAFLYNYIDDIHEDDLSYFGGSLANHGAHPYMDLYEGNIFSHFMADDFFGSSSHNVLFRNHIWGDESVPVASEWLNPPGALTKPNWGIQPVEVWSLQHYYSLVGNVLGSTPKWLAPNWSTYTVLANGCSANGGGLYNYGCEFTNGSNNDPAAYSTSINHGNWDYKTGGVAYWDGGANHSLRNSMYYTSKPSFFGGCAWPPFGPEGNPSIGTLPAKARFEGDTSCGTAATKPTPPSGLTVTTVN
jgi:hypothetical protein